METARKIKSLVALIVCVSAGCFADGWMTGKMTLLELDVRTPTPIVKISFVSGGSIQYVFSLAEDRGFGLPPVDNVKMVYASLLSAKALDQPIMVYVFSSEEVPTNNRRHFSGVSSTIGY